MSCETDVCGIGGWGGPKPGDPSNNSVLSATPAFGGVDVSWSYPATNPYAVAHTLLYKGINSNFANANQIAVVAGNFFYDKTTASVLVQYYYWIQIVSVNGTVGATIGPASATAKPVIAEVIANLSAQIDASFLAQSLKSTIDKISLNTQAIVDEANRRIAANSAYSQMLAQIQSGAAQTATLISTEITNRREGDSALLDQITTIAAANRTNAALIIEERVARVSSTDAIGALYTTLNAQVNDPVTGLPKTRAILLNDYYTKVDTNSAISSANTSLTASFDNKLKNYTTTAGLVLDYYTKTDTNAAISAANTSLASSFNNSLTRYTTTADLQNNYYTKASVDGAISSANTTTQVSFGNQLASAKVTLESTIGIVDGKVTAIGSLYTAKVNVNGLVGGFGVYNDGRTIDAGFDVDTFWIGKSGVNSVKPFIVKNGTVYINDAVINSLKFSKLTNESGSFIVDSLGRIEAKYLAVEQVTSGAFSTYAWPPDGRTGFYLGPGGLLMGNYSTGKYVQITDTGDMYMPGLKLEGGNATFSGKLSANIVQTENIQGSAITTVYAANSAGPVVTVRIYTPDTTQSIVIMGSAGQTFEDTISSGESLQTVVRTPNGKLLLDGFEVLTQDGAMVFATSLYTVGWHDITFRRDFMSGVMSLAVIVQKR